MNSNNDYVTVPRAQLQYIRDLLTEKVYGSSARSPGHNARLVVDDLLSAAPPAQMEAVGYILDSELDKLRRGMTTTAAISPRPYVKDDVPIFASPVPSPVQQEAVAIFTVETERVGDQDRFTLWNVTDEHGYPGFYLSKMEAIAAIKELYASPVPSPVQMEAVAWRFKYRDCLGWLYRDERDWIPNEPYNVHDVQPLYASPVPSSAQEAVVWQPIETAPKGKKVIVYGDVPGMMHPQTSVARYWPRHTLPVAEDFEDEDWVDHNNDGDAFMPEDWYEEMMGEDAPAVNLKPTHWMPLPAAPGASPVPSSERDGPSDPLGRPTYDDLIAALAQCREAIPDDPDDDVERTSAIAYPLFVPDLVKKFVARSEAERDEQPKPSVFIPSNEILVSRDDIIEMCAKVADERLDAILKYAATMERDAPELAEREKVAAAEVKNLAFRLRSMTSQPAQEAE